jgi:hypothetical protein
MACGQSCTSCTLTGAGCAQGEGCTVDKLCAPLSCSGAADGLACSLPSVLAGLLQTSPASYQYGPELLLTECCGGNCTDLDFDSSNCGACGGLCPVGTACQGGQCLQAIDCALAADATPCWLGPQAEGTCCGGACVDTSSAPANCGYCGQACQPGDACEAPYCLSNDGGAAYFPNEVLCSPGSDGENCALDGGLGVCCAGTCADPNAIENCAECGLGCLPCAAGCPGGTTCVNQGSRYDGSQLVQIETCLPTFCQPGESGGECAFGPSVLGPLQHFGAGNWAAGRLVDQIAGFCCDGACVDIALRCDLQPRHLLTHFRSVCCLSGSGAKQRLPRDLRVRRGLRSRRLRRFLLPEPSRHRGLLRGRGWQGGRLLSERCTGVIWLFRSLGRPGKLWWLRPCLPIRPDLQPRRLQRHAGQLRHRSHWRFLQPGRGAHLGLLLRHRLHGPGSRRRELWQLRRSL